MKAPTPAPRVTVVVPCYNYGRYLTECVESVLSQEVVDVDVLIVDDASTDDSADVARRLAAGDARVSVICHRQNIGHIATYNDGLGRAEGDYLVLLSADDMLTPGSLARATAVMESRPRVGLVYGNPLILSGEDVSPSRTRPWGVRVWDGPDWISAQCRRSLGCIYCPEACVRASVQRAVGDYAANLPHTADLDMWLRIAATADVARVRRSDQAYRRVHGAGMMQTTFAGLLRDLRGRRDAYESFFAGPGSSLPRSRQDLATVRERLAEEALDHACSLLRRDGPVSPEIHDYVAFAAEVQRSEVSRLRQWHEYHLLRAGVQHPATSQALSLRYSLLRRELEGNYRLRRWRLTGV